MLKIVYRQLNRIPMPKPEKIEVLNETINETQSENRTINADERNKTIHENNSSQGQSSNQTNSDGPKQDEL